MYLVKEGYPLSEEVNMQNMRTDIVGKEQESMGKMRKSEGKLR